MTAIVSTSTTAEAPALLDQESDRQLDRKINISPINELSVCPCSTVDAGCCVSPVRFRYTFAY